MGMTEKSLIPKGMVIVGDVFMDGDLELYGEVIGNVQAENLRLNGVVKGNLDIEQRVNIEKGAMIMGKISAGETNVTLGSICEIEMEQKNAERSASRFFAEYMKNHKPSTTDDFD